MQYGAHKVNIGKEDLCVCGSGVKYENCCMKKGHIYEAMVIDETGKQLIYDQSEVISGVESLLKFLEWRINGANSTLSYEESRRKIKKLFEKLDTSLKPIGTISSCNLGCNHCCHLLVLTSKLEYEIINEFLHKNFSEEKILDIKEKINKHSTFFKNLNHNNEKFSVEDYEIYVSKKIPCGFLSHDNQCIIYDVRPFVCRKYLVFNDSSICGDPLNKTNQYYAKYLTTTKDAIAKLNRLTYGNNLEYKHLLSWFADN
ncbi:SEC-C domain-containing protein [Clostridium sp.]|uniref:SEC-C domain-containing protein n=1 Tax=Clostridium sp. TaxID=1506 RepID=UPI002FC5A234